MSMESLNSGHGWCGVVLAGGKSSRMGRDKALLVHNGRPLIAHAADLLRPLVDDLLIIGDPLKYGHAGARTVADERPGSGPLGGIVTALGSAWYERSIVLACDMPNITPAFLEYLMRLADTDHDAVVAQCDGRLEPLAAVYHRRCRRAFLELLERGELRMSDAIERVRTCYVQICPGEDGWPEELFRNINTPADL